MKKNAVLIVSAALLISCVHMSVLDTLAVSVSPDGTLWSYGSKQKISWSLSGSDSEAYTLVFFLENESVRGCIGHQSTLAGAGEINFVANTVLTGDGSFVHLQDGEYRLTAALCPADDSDAVSSVYGCPEDSQPPLAEKTVGIITIADSEVQDGTD